MPGVNHPDQWREGKEVHKQVVTGGEARIKGV